MKQIKLSLTIIATIISYESFCQTIVGKNEKDGSEYKFEVIESNPSEINNLFVGPEFLGVEIGQGFFMGYGLDANYLYKDKFHFKVNTFRPFFKGTDSEKGDYYRGEEENGVRLRLYNKSEVGITCYFKSKANEKKAKIILKEQSVGFNTREVFVLNTSIPNQTRFGARFGYYYYQQSARESLKLIADTSAKGIPVYVSSFTNHSLYLGLSSSSFQHFVVDSKEFDESAKSRYRTFYFDPS